MHCSSPRASAGLMMLRRVDRAFGRAGADQRVQLVDEQDDLAGRAADLVHHALHALFELAAVLRAGDQAGQVERDHALVAQRLGNLGLDDALRQAFGDRRLADAGLADQGRVVLGAAREDLDDALDLGGAADDRVELVLAGEDASGRGRRRRASGSCDLPFGAGGWPSAPSSEVVCTRTLAGSTPEVGQHARRHAFTLADEAEQQMFGADVVVVELARFFEGQFDHALGARREDHLLLDGLAAAADDRLDFLAHLRQD